jgi:uncharacterized membrane protein YgcG
MWVRSIIVVLAPVCLLAACADLDPYRRTDVWRPTGAMQSNLAAMLANPHDLIQGRGDTDMDTHNSATAILRVWGDTPRSLSPSQTAPAISMTSGAGSGGGQAPSSGGDSGGSGSGGSNGSGAASSLFPSLP